MDMLKNLVLLICTKNLFEPWYLARLEGLTLAQKKQVLKEILLSMNAQDDNCSVILNCLSFAKFSDYVANRKLAKSDPNKKSKLLSSSMYEGCCSALMHLYQVEVYCVRGFCKRSQAVHVWAQTAGELSCLDIVLIFLHLYCNYDHCNISFVGASGKSKTWWSSSQVEQKMG